MLEKKHQLSSKVLSELIKRIRGRGNTITQVYLENSGENGVCGCHCSEWWCRYGHGAEGGGVCVRRHRGTTMHHNTENCEWAIGSRLLVEREKCADVSICRPTSRTRSNHNLWPFDVEVNPCLQPAMNYMCINFVVDSSQDIFILEHTDRQTEKCTDTTDCIQ